MDLPIDAGDGHPLSGPAAAAGLAFYYGDQAALPPTQSAQPTVQDVPGSGLGPGTQLYSGDDAFGCWTQDPMDIDYDTDLASWVSSWGRSWGLPQPRSPSHQPQPQQQHQQQQHHHRSQSKPHHQNHQNHQRNHPRNQHHQHHLSQPMAPLPSSQGATTPLFKVPSIPTSFTELETGAMMAHPVTGPDDLLFPDDETVAMVTVDCGHHAAEDVQPQPQSQPAPAAAPTLDLNDPATLGLYDEMLIFSRGNFSADRQLTFEQCDAAKESILYRLAMRLKLSYSYNPMQRRVCVWNPAVAPTDVPTIPAKRARPSERRRHSFQPLEAGFVAEDDTQARVQFHNHSTRNTISSPMIFSPPTTQSDTSADHGGSSATTPTLLAAGPADEESPDSPSLGDRLSSSWSIFHSGIASRRPRGRHGPLSAKSRKDIKDLEWAGGACWRCKILRRKCDPGIPCKNCPAPDLREDASPWPLIGCRRGSLCDAMPPQVLCSRSRSLLSDGSRRLSAVFEAESAAAGSLLGVPGVVAMGQPDVVSQCIHSAEAQCLFDNKLVLENAAMYLQAHGQSEAAQHYTQAIRNGRYRANVALNETCRVHERTTTYSELLGRIAWELVDNSESLSVLEIESVESFVLLLETACVYEIEVGKSPMVALSMVCLRCCMDALRLSGAGLLHAQLHGGCRGDRCAIACLRELAQCIETYIEELALLMFRKVNLRDRRWWLSTFYSLCIQAYVRRALLAIEQQLLFPGLEDVDADALFSSQYLHLVTVLFIAVSFQYDPLVAGNGGLRLQQLLEEGETPVPMATVSTTTTAGIGDMCVPERFFTLGRAACAVDAWANEGIKSSYQFLTRLLNIGSLDFDMGHQEDRDTQESADAVQPLRHSFSGYSTPNSSATSFASSQSAPWSGGMTSPASSCGLLSSTSSPRTSLLVSDRRSSIGSLPSRLSVASFPGTGLAAGATAGVAASDAPAGQLVCVCCPTRPQRFDTAEELRVHQNKKPHICAFCGRRFSRMNETERHITTIHLRPFSWSCGRLRKPLRAYQCVRDGTTAYDLCGFCGRQFRRPPEGTPETSQAHAEYHAQLAAHVEQDHKVHECKARGKKFFREDMFGQHLKLSHGAEPGIWLKFLENVCKADEGKAAAAASTAAKATAATA